MSEAEHTPTIRTERLLLMPATEFQRRGYATEAVRGMTKFAFRDLRVQAVVGLTIPSLIPSIGVLKKAEFRFEGEGSDPHAPEGEVVLRYVLTRDRFTGA